MTAKLTTYAPDGRENWTINIGPREYRARLKASALVSLEVMRKPGPRRYGRYPVEISTEGPTAQSVLAEIQRARRLAARTLRRGDLVRVMVPGCGDVDFSDLGAEAPTDWERHYEAGALAVVGDVESLDQPQGFAVTVTIIEGPGRWVDNVFDEMDKGMEAFPFARVEGADIPHAQRLAEKSKRDVARGPLGYEPEQLS